MAKTEKRRKANEKINHGLDAAVLCAVCFVLCAVCCV